MLQRLRRELSAPRGAAPVRPGRLSGVDAGKAEIVAEPLEDGLELVEDRRQLLDRALAARDRVPELCEPRKASRALVVRLGGLVDLLAGLGHAAAFECARGEIDEEGGTLLVAVR
jgi:hypothetical protein